MSRPTTRHVAALLLVGEDPLYACAHPDNVQVLLEVTLDGAALEILRDDRGQYGDGTYTVALDRFPISELEPRDADPVPTTLSGTLVRGHAERGGTPLARGVRVDVRRVVSFTELDGNATPEPARTLEYLCFGRAGRMYLVHRLRARPSFDQVLAVRFVPGTVRTQVGHPQDDDVAALQFDRAQRVDIGREDVADQRLTAGEVVTAAFPLTRSPNFSRGFTVQAEVERQLYLDVDEPA